MTTITKAGSTLSDPLARDDYRRRTNKALWEIQAKLDLVEICLPKACGDTGTMLALQDVKARAENLLAEYFAETEGKL